MDERHFLHHFLLQHTQKYRFTELSWQCSNTREYLRSVKTGGYEVGLFGNATVQRELRSTQPGHGTFMNSKWDTNMSQGEEEARWNVGSGWEQNKHIKEELTDVRE